MLKPTTVRDRSSSTHRIFTLAVTATLLLGARDVLAGDNLLANGSFENGSTPGCGFWCESSCNVQGWANGTIDLWTLEAGTFDGYWMIDLNGCQAGWVQQSAVCTPGLSYRLSFAIGADAYPGDCGSPQMKQVRVTAGTQQWVFTVSPASGAPPYPIHWEEHTVDFVASTSSVPIRFESIIGGCKGAWLDKVALTETEADPPTGNVIGWGYNAYEQCTPPSNLTACTQVAGGAFHTVALQKDGTVRCWGLNDYGPCDVPANLQNVKSIAAGSRHSLAVQEDGVLRLWGWNGYGQLNIPAGLGPCLQVAGGSRHTTALRSNGTVWCWGSNAQGQCSVPSNLGIASRVANGGFHSMALLADGSVRCWGSNTNFEGTVFEGQSSPPANLGACMDISGGGYFSTALKPSGVVAAWGANEGGQCNVPTDLGVVSKLAAGDTHVVALLQDGHVRCWGTQVDGATTVPSSVSTAVDVAAGFYHSLAVVSSEVPPCAAADIYRDGLVDGADLGILLAHWGPVTPSSDGDINRDGLVDGADLGSLLASWGPCSR